MKQKQESPRLDWQIFQALKDIQTRVNFDILSLHAFSFLRSIFISLAQTITTDERSITNQFLLLCTLKMSPRDFQQPKTNAKKIPNPYYDDSRC